MRRRQVQVAAQIQKDLASILYLESRDPRITSAALTRVLVSADLRRARVFYRTEPHVAAAAQAGFEAAKRFFRGRLAQKMSLRFVPELEFEYDEAFAKADRVLQLLDELKTT